MADAHGIARKTAKRLAPEFGEALPLTVEKVIYGAAGKPGQFDLATVIALAALIVQCAQLAFDISMSRGGGKVGKEALKRALRLELRLPEGVSEKARDVVIQAVAEETDTQGGE